MFEHLIDPNLIELGDLPSIIAVIHHEDYPQQTPMHRHARGQLLGAQHGLMTVGMVNSQWLVPAIHAVWLPPHQDHALVSHGPFSGWSVYIAESDCQTLPAEPCTLRMTGLLKEAVLRAASWTALIRDKDQRCLEGVILGEVRSMVVESLGLPMPQNPRLVRVTQALLADLADKRSAHAWAEWAGMSVRSFSRHFTDETGFAFTAWRQRARLMRALELLAADEPVTSIAFELGYEDVSAFIGMFRRHFGVTPKKYFTHSMNNAS